MTEVTTPAGPTPLAELTVHARRWEGGWELHIMGVGVTQCTDLRYADSIIRSYVSLTFETDPQSFSYALYVEEDI